MELVLNNCTTAVFKPDKVEELKHPAGPQNDFSKPGQEDIYKYLGTEEMYSIQHSKMKEKIAKDYQRVHLVLKSELKKQDLSHQRSDNSSPHVHLWDHWLEEI